MKRKVDELMQKTQHSINELNSENIMLNNEKEKLSEHYEMKQKLIIEAYEDSIKALMEKKKQLSEILKRSLNDQKVDLGKQKTRVVQKLEQASVAAERLGRFIVNMENLSFDDYNKFMEELGKEAAELEAFANFLPHIEVTYMQFHENMNILDRSVADNYSKRNSVHSKTDVGTGLGNSSKEVLQEAPANASDKKQPRKRLSENAAAGARTSRYAKPNTDIYFSEENRAADAGGEAKKLSIKAGVTNPFVEESLMAKVVEKIGANPTAGE